jgi:hypothetical protein
MVHQSLALRAFSMSGPGAAVGGLDWGPQLHGSSSWNRPGVEYGTGLTFPAAGCSDVHVALGQLTGDVYVLVA